MGSHSKPFALPSGLIVIWQGALANIPSGWLLCDGNNGTPNLLAKFLEGVATAATDPGATGGEATHTLTTAEMPAHAHYQRDTAVGSVPTSETSAENRGLNPKIVPTSSTGDGGAHENKPPFYDIAFIMKT